MNSPLPQLARFRRLMGDWLLMLAILLSITAGTFVWLQPIPPLWVYDPTATTEENMRVIGLTSDGRVVSVDCPSGENARCRLRVRDVQTGRIVADYEIPNGDTLSQNFHGELSGDGELAILCSRFDATALVLSLKTGELRYPPLRGVYEVGSCSPDGRFAVLETFWGGDDGASYRIIDLGAGEFRWKSESWTQFSADGKSFLNFRFEKEKRLVSIRSLEDNAELLSDVVPQMPAGTSALLHGWSGGRLYVLYSNTEPGAHPSDRLCWSYDTASHRLNDPRFEPLIRGAMLDQRTFVFSVFRGKYRGEVRLHFSSENGSLLDQIHDKLDDLGFRLGERDLEQSWQPLSLEAGHPVGVRIQGISHRFKVSPNGDWLVDGGEQLRVWQLPAQRGYSRWLQTALFSLIPWALLFIRRRQRGADSSASIQARGSPS